MNLIHSYFEILIAYGFSNLKYDYIDEQTYASNRAI